MRKSIVRLMKNLLEVRKLFDRWCHLQSVDESQDRLMTASFNRGV